MKFPDAFNCVSVYNLSAFYIETREENLMASKKGIDRRSFIKATATALAGAGTMLTARPGRADQTAESKPLLKIKSYRTLGRTGFKVSDIGVGTSQLYHAPVISAALDAGINYIDTAEGYGRGASERSIGEAIKGRNRKSIFLTTKINMAGVTTPEQVREKVDQCLERLQTGYVDCLMLPGPPTADAVKNEIFHQTVGQLKKEGKVLFTGVASHGARIPGQGDPMEKVLLAAIEDGRFDVVLLVYNFLQKEAGEKVLEAAEKKNIGTTIMKSNPLGRYYDMRDRVAKMKAEGQTVDERLLQSLTQMEETARQAEEFIKARGLNTPEEIKIAALKFVLEDPRVHTLNLAFSTFEDVQNYVSLSGESLKTREKQMLASFEKECGSLYCRHACGICESHCPNQIPVNTIMRYNHYFEAQGTEKFAMEKYASLGQSRIEACRGCAGLCEQACPFGVPVRGLLMLAHQQLSLP